MSKKNLNKNRTSKKWTDLMARHFAGDNSATKILQNEGLVMKSGKLTQAGQQLAACPALA